MLLLLLFLAVTVGEDVGRRLGLGEVGWLALLLQGTGASGRGPTGLDAAIPVPKHDCVLAHTSAPLFPNDILFSPF